MLLATSAYRMRGRTTILPHRLDRLGQAKLVGKKKMLTIEVQTRTRCRRGARRSGCCARLWRGEPPHADGPERDAGAHEAQYQAEPSREQGYRIDTELVRCFFPEFGPCCSNAHQKCVGLIATNIKSVFCCLGEKRCLKRLSTTSPT